jgi:NAD(P)-dependent dehydrogenase (short-subunit alcohol dehydrogenase family)/acyl carrier protein
LQETLGARRLFARRVLHLWSLDQPAAAEDFRVIQERGSCSVLAYVQGLNLAGPISGTSLLVVTAGAHCVLDDDEIRPAVAPVFGPCRTIPQEYPAVSCRSVDVEPRPGSAWADSVVDRLLADACLVENGLTLAYRRGYRWLQTYEPLDIDLEASSLRLRENGAYLVTGGLGQLGLLIAQWVATRTRARLILTSRTGLPPRNEWPAATGSDSTHAAAIEVIRAIEESGSVVDVLAVDVADQAAMTAVCAEIGAKHGSISGVFHCAGATRAEHFAPVASVTPALWDQHFRPKAYGVEVLQRALAGHDPDFVVLMSSLSAILGGLGFLPYASANLFMDAFAHARRTDGPSRWISVNWDGWSLDEEAAGDDVDEADGDRTGDGLVADEGLAALDCILTSPPGSQVVVVAGELEPRLRQWVALDEVHTVPVAEREDAQLHLRPRLAVPYRAPEGDLELHIASLWQQLLGLSQVGADDNFFELGGHSLLAIQLAARLRERYAIELGVDLVFSAPTVAGLAVEIEQRRAGIGGVDAAALEALVSQLEEMDESQVRALLAEDDGGADARGQE